MPLVLHGLGTAVPPDGVTTAESLKSAQVLGHPAIRTASWLPAVYAKSGVRTRFQVLGRPFINDLLTGTRLSGSPFLPGDDPLGPTTAQRMAMYAELAPKLAVQAAANALVDSGLSAKSITHLVTVSCTGFASPGFDFAMIRELGLRPTTERIHVGFMGCHGAINGLRAALALAADPANTVLLAAVELCSLHYYTGPDIDKAIANALFADGAAAIVASGRGAGGYRVAATGSGIIPDSAAEMGWFVGDHGFEMVLSKQIPVFIERSLRTWIDAWLGERGLTVGQIGSWAIHPGGPRILHAAQAALGLTDEAMSDSRAVYAEFGNMSSPTVLFILKRLRERRAAAPVVLLGFGPGLVCEAALITGE